jgi:hypothetical protein
MVLKTFIYNNLLAISCLNIKFELENYEFSNKKKITDLKKIKNLNSKIILTNDGLLLTSRCFL